MPLTADENKDRLKVLKSRLKQIIVEHVVTISEDSYELYKSHAHQGPLITPGEDRAAIDKMSRQEWAAINIMDYASYGSYNRMRSRYSQSESLIQWIEDIPVYFAEEGGIYYLYDPETDVNLEVWLTWPAYPIGWG